MRNLKLHLFTFLFLANLVSFATPVIKVRLFSNLKDSRAVLSVRKGSYAVIAQDIHGNDIDTVAVLNSAFGRERTAYIGSAYGQLIFNRERQKLGRFDRLSVRCIDNNNYFNIRYKGEERTYEGHLNLKVIDGVLQVINEVELEQYVAGVVESEGGHSKSYEYFKAQAVLARTFAVTNYTKYLNKGYNLTDDVRSQVYHSRCYLENSKLIKKATTATRGEILVDNVGKPIVAAFHANSGGYTANSEDVWVTAVSYLKSKKDDFSLNQNSSSWELSMSKEKYLSFFKRYHPNLLKNAKSKKKIMQLKQNTRLGYISLAGNQISTADMRNFFKLRSSFFEVSTRGNQVYFKGKGYGHGIGLSQDGAMRMAELGHKYNEILKFYFSKVELAKVQNYI